MLENCADSSQDQRDYKTCVGILHPRNHGETGTSEGLWDRLGSRISQMEMADAFNCSNLWIALLQPAKTLGSH